MTPLIFTNTSSRCQRQWGRDAHSLDPFAPDLGGEHRAEPVPPEPHGLMADLDAALVQEVLDVAQRERVSDIEHHGQADDLGAGLEVPEGGALGHLREARRQPQSAQANFALTVPERELRLGKLRNSCPNLVACWLQSALEIELGRCDTGDKMRRLLLVGICASTAFFSSLLVASPVDAHTLVD